MTAQLVLIHGRAQQGKEAAALKAEWLEALARGLADQQLALPIQETDVHFPYYGDTLAQLTADPNAPNVPEIIVRGDDTADAEQIFVRAVLTELLAGAGVTEAVIRAEAPTDIIERGPLSWEWVHSGLSIIDRFVPGASGKLVALVTRDVSKYLLVPGVRRRIDRGVAGAFAACPSGENIVVVAHSLGTVVAYNLLRQEGPVQGWRVPKFITVGSPLGVEAIRRALSPLSHPGVVAEWFNVFDQRDVVALYPLDRGRFDVTPQIDNHDGVRNESSNHHGINEYLADPRVAREIWEALQ